MKRINKPDQADVIAFVIDGEVYTNTAASADAKIINVMCSTRGRQKNMDAPTLNDRPTMSGGAICSRMSKKGYTIKTVFEPVYNAYKLIICKRQRVMFVNGASEPDSMMIRFIWR